MENIDIDFGQTVSSGAVSMLVAGAILVLSVLIVAIIITAKRWKGITFVCNIWIYVFTNVYEHYKTYSKCGYVFHI